MFNKQTTLDLDGPKLGFSTDPQDLTVNTGTAATFVAIGTAIFPSNIPAQFATNTGIVTYRWYVDDIAVTDGDSYAGSGTTTLQIYNNTTAKTVYCEADYIPSAYGLPGVAVTVGSARSTGHAISEPIRSASATLSITPTLSIDTQPVDRSVSVGVAATFGVNASLSDDSTDGFSYQWQVNGSDVSDGTLVVSGTKTNTAKLTYTKVGETIGTVVDFSELSTVTIGAGIYDITVDQDVVVDLVAKGAAGQNSNLRDVAGGSGGRSTGTFTFLSGTLYKLDVGFGGKQAGQGSGGSALQVGGGKGGGLTGLFVEAVEFDKAIIIAGGGGGGAADPATGGDGGGLTGGDAANAPSRGGEGGTQIIGGRGEGNSVNQDGGQLQGGTGDGSGGGGGYYGGGGGLHDANVNNGAGGGGSGYIGSSLLTNPSTTQGAGASYVNTTGFTRGHGSFQITLTDTTLAADVNLTVSGATTDVLTLSSDGNVSVTTNVVVSNSNASNSPVTSETRSFRGADARPLIRIEQINNTDTAILSSHNLQDSEIAFTDETHPANQICIYAPERDIEIEMDVYGGKGLPVDFDPSAPLVRGNAESGEGGKATIRFTLEQNVEYIITGLYAEVNAPFIYRKASLIAVSGGGGRPTNFGNGLMGGGVGVPGEQSGSITNHVGGLNRPAIFSSIAEIPNSEVVAPDVPATGGMNNFTPGRTHACPPGKYWRDQGLSPCEDIPSGNKFRLGDGTEVKNTSSSITRGFKAGYINILTAGQGNPEYQSYAGGTGQDVLTAGNGGSGATGGIGAFVGGAFAGGGGGSGYSDGSVTIVSNQLGGSTGVARINLRLADSGFYIDDEGRILIYSHDIGGGNELGDPSEGAITQTTGVVNFKDNKCIDDARWQKFLDLARDGTKDYRLTVTGGGDAVTNATEKNIYKMMNANTKTLSISLTEWHQVRNYDYTLKVLAWDEDSGRTNSNLSTVTGKDYSMLSWSPRAANGYGAYGFSENPFFTRTHYGIKNRVDFWILPPGVPDFPIGRTGVHP